MNTFTRFREMVLNVPGAAALYGSRVYRHTAPLDTLKGVVFLTLNTISSNRAAAHDGDGKTSSTFIQVRVGGPDGDAVDEVKSFLIESLNGNEYATSTGSIVPLLTNEQDGSEDLAPRMFYSILDFEVLDDNDNT